MRAFVTGATGFLGGALARRLRERGDEVVALVRSPHKAGELERLGCSLVPGDLSDEEAVRRGAEGADAVFHVAALYEVGVPKSRRGLVWDANVRGTERVLDAAIAAGAARIVYVSTVNVFGNTHGKVVDESHHRDEAEGFLSVYDETKYRGHLAAEERIAAGAPVLVAQPGGVYGPGDTSYLAGFFDLVRKGYLKVLTFPETGLNMGYVDDIAEGLLLVHDRGTIGEAYVLGGEITTVGDLIRRTAVLAGKRPPRLTLPPALVKLSIPLGPLIGRLTGTGPNLREVISAAEDVTYWATDAKARRELGYTSRDLETGLRQTLEALSAG